MYNIRVGLSDFYMAFDHLSEERSLCSTYLKK